MFFIPFKLPPNFKWAKEESKEEESKEESKEEDSKEQDSEEQDSEEESLVEEEELVAIEQNKEEEDYTEIVDIESQLEQEPFTLIQKEAVRPPTPAFVEIKKSQSGDTCCTCTLQ